MTSQHVVGARDGDRDCPARLVCGQLDTEGKGLLWGALGAGRRARGARGGGPEVWPWLRWSASGPGARVERLAVLSARTGGDGLGGAGGTGWHDPPPRQGFPEISTLPWFTLFAPLVCLLVIRATRDLVDDIVSVVGGARRMGGQAGAGAGTPAGRAWGAESASCSGQGPPVWVASLHVGAYRAAGGRRVVGRGWGRPSDPALASPGATQERQAHQQQALPDPGGEEVRPRGPVEDGWTVGAARGCQRWGCVTGRSRWPSARKLRLLDVLLESGGAFSVVSQPQLLWQLLSPKPGWARQSRWRLRV